MSDAGPRDTNAISNYQDEIYSRDIDARISELEDGLPREDYEPGIPLTQEQEAELAALRALRDDVAGYAGERRWRDGLTLIHDGYFTSYAQDVAAGLHGSAATDLRWPFNHVDWDAAAAELENDYKAVDFDGQPYLYRM